MALIKRNGNLAPVRSLLTDLLDVDRFFDSDLFDLGARFNNLPSVNIEEKEKEFKVELAAPGFAKKDFSINLQNDVLTISAEKKEEKEQSEKEFKRREFNYSSFQRSFALPETVNEDQINAEYKDGILKLTLPKREGTEKKRTKEISVA